jgi:osmoprotectant transport system permease protein
MTMQLIWEHLFLVFAASMFSVLCGLPLGILAYAFPRARAFILRVTDVLQTIPALALLGIIMVFIGAGKVTVIIGITLYSLLPIVRNTCIGLEQVDPGVREAARGMGMTDIYRVMVVELPLAFPTVFTGIRIAVVNAIGTAVFAAFVGGGGLGSVLNRGIRIQDMELILSGTAALCAIALLMDMIMGWFESQLRRGGAVRSKRVALALAAVLVLFVCVLPVGLRDNTGDDTIVLYDGDYSETQIMHRMVKMLVEDKTELSVEICDQMSQVNNFKALSADKPTCDLMLSYDGTLMTTFLHRDVTEVPAGETLFDYSSALANEQYGVMLLDKIGFDNTYAVAMPESLAEQYNIRTISDLVPLAENFVFGAEHDFFTQEGSMKYNPFVAFYGLHFRDSVSVDVSLKYAAIESGSFDVTEVFATDGLNRKAGLRVLEDDRSFFPEYNGAFVVRSDLFERFAGIAPNLREVLGSLAGQISNDDMVEMTYQVDVNGRTVDDVAREFLVARGLIGN